ncbi:MAG: ABC transporter permease [Vicinamibacterales bacterium]
MLIGLHGLVHLLGTIVYWQLAEVDGFAFKTTVLNGLVDLGARGIQTFGLLWLLPAVGFVAAALGLWTGWDSWVPMLMASTLVSLVLVGVDWQVAFAGAYVDVAILLAMVARAAGWARF